MFTKATKSQAKLRCAIFGASGCGKTYSALRMAKGIGGKIALIDTEYFSASKYSDRFDFDVANLDNNQIRTYTNAIKQAAKQQYNVLIIDSLSHAWTQLLQEIDKIAKAKYRGNTWSAWSEGTPQQKELINSILSYPGHVIATMRCKTEWTIESTNNGKTKPIRVALAPEQGKGIEYEFDLLIELTPDHMANIIKDRTGKFQDKIIDKPGEDFGVELREWLDDGTSYFIEKDQVDILKNALLEHEVDLNKFYTHYNIKELSSLKSADFNKAMDIIKSKPLKEIQPLSTEPKEESKTITKEALLSDEPFKEEEEQEDVVLEKQQKFNMDKSLNTIKKLQNENRTYE